SFAEAYTTAAAAYASVLQQGKINAAGIDCGEKARDDFITALNNCDGSAECIETLKNTLSNDFSQCFVKLSDHDSEKLKSCLAQLDDVRKQFSSLVQSSLEQLLASAVRPRLKSTIDLFLDETHTPSEAEFAEMEASDVFVQQLVTVLDSVLNVFKAFLNQSVYNSFLEIVAGSVAVDLEKVILNATYNRLGGLVLDKQIRGLSAYWTTVASWCLREKFSRLSQVVSLLNVESVVDAEGFYKSTSLAWLLSPTEIKQVLALRVDLPGNDIRQLVL
ncbi:unnamed protein product, partial [Soboliphyme baturini]|uniref:Conserved oligomeric Golgi complex subunit 4 n=1 Tax=Soboliphyme baturini TaxID=241478 RepID=A0A183J9A5_9BILA